MTLSDHRDAAEREAIVAALQNCKYNQRHAAAALGVHRNTFLRLRQKHHIGIKATQRSAAARQAYYDSQRRALAVLGIA